MLPPIRKSIRVPWDPEKAFRRFTKEIGFWWPLKSHSVGGDRAQAVVREGFTGGRIIEKIRGGEESVWGTIRVWDPPRRVTFSWHPGRPSSEATLVEVQFERVSGGTRVVLTHSNWEAMGPMAKIARRGYPIGWTYVLRLYADRANSLIAKSIEVLQVLLGPLQRRAARKARLGVLNEN